MDQAEKLIYRSVGLEGPGDFRLRRLFAFVFNDSEEHTETPVGVLIGLLIAEHDGWGPTWRPPAESA